MGFQICFFHGQQIGGISMQDFMVSHHFPNCCMAIDWG